MSSEKQKLTSEDKTYLVRVLNERLGTQREGIYHSETSTFKDEMKQEEHLLRRLIEKLKIESVPT
jgi:hypothetical protein